MILVGIGANLIAPDGSAPIDTCRRAAIALDSMAGFRLVGLSRWFATKPIPASDQPDYVNGVASMVVLGSSDPTDLLIRLQTIESFFGRVRTVPNAPRTLDLDIVAIGGLVRAAPDPILPHPRCHERAFVLEPLRDVAPNWVHPTTSRTAAEMLATLGDQGVRPLAG